MVLRREPHGWLNYPDAGAAYSAAPNLREVLPLVVNTEEETLSRNIRAAMARGHDVVDVQSPHEKTALLVGGGPSIKGDVENIRQRQKDGAVIFALNNAGHWLVSNGIIPDFVVVLDARAHNARFVEGLPQETSLLLASQCAPEVYDAAGTRPVIMWHAPTNGTSGVVERRKFTFIIGGMNVGIRAMSLAFILGYRTIHLYGFDSSYADDEAHAYKQPENDNDRLITAVVSGRQFLTTPWMARQADDFREIAPQMMAAGVTLHVHGDGLLPWLAHSMNQREPIGDPLKYLTLVYDLQVAPPCYDFLTVLAMAERERIDQGLQALKVVIVPGGGSFGSQLDDPAYREQMTWNVMLGLARCMPSVKDVVVCGSRAVAQGHITGPIFPPDYDVEIPTERYGFTRLIHQLNKTDLAFFKAPKWCLEQVRKWIKPKTVTFTLREADHARYRNTDKESWLRAADDLKKRGYNVIFIRDTAKAYGVDFYGHEVCHAASFDIGLRLALYELADVNCFCANGPFTLAMLAKNVRALFFDMLHDEGRLSPGSWAQRGIPVGSQFPHSAGRHKIVWGKDIPDTIIREVVDFRRPAEFRACYDLAELPANWDAVTWLALADMQRRREGVNGPLKIAFKRGPNGGFRNDGLVHSPAERQKYLDNIVRPLLPMIGAVEDDLAEDGQKFPYLMRHVVQRVDRGEKVPRFTAPADVLRDVDEWLKQFEVKPVTVTLREASHWPERNNKLEHWLEFAREIKSRPIVFVRDTEKAQEPLDGFWTCPRASRDVQFRMALYQRAKVNLFTSGPAMMAFFSDVPYLHFAPLIDPAKANGWPAGTPEWWRDNCGTPVGSNFAWATQFQRIVWEEPTPEVIIGAYRKLISDMGDEY